MAQDTPRPSPQYKGGLCTLERQKAGNKTQRQELEDKGEADGNKGKRAGVFVGEGGVTEDCLWIERRRMWPR